MTQDVGPQGGVAIENVSTIPFRTKGNGIVFGLTKL
jgi:hypothetical protein